MIRKILSFCDLEIYIIVTWNMEQIIGYCYQKRKKLNQVAFETFPPLISNSNSVENQTISFKIRMNLLEYKYLGVTLYANAKKKSFKLDMCFSNHHIW